VIGSADLAGTELVGRSVRDIIRAGVGYVPEDRSHDGLIGDFTVAENLVLNRYDEAPFASGPSLRRQVVEHTAQQLVAEFDVRTQGVRAGAGSLSGGNQQKVVVARELSRPLRLLVASQPTRGVDVGSVEFLHQRLVGERDAGVPVLLVSTELDEISALADRVAVMYRGRIVGVVPGGTSRDVLGLMVAGVAPDQAERAAAEHATLTGGEATEEQLDQARAEHEPPQRREHP
jgi:simple sugar transport system ATP-binding protein